MPRGKVVKIEGAIGYIQVPGSSKDLFFHRSALPPGGVKLGQEVDYDDGMGPKGPRAENIRIADPTAPVVVPAQPTAAAAPAAARSAAAPARRDVEGLSVFWHCRKPEGDNLPVEVTLKRGTNPVLDVPVTLLVNAKKVKGATLTPNADGKAEFIITLPWGAEQVGLQAQIGNRLYGYIWNRNSAGTEMAPSDAAPEPATTSVPAEPSVRFVSKDKGLYTFALTGASSTEVRTEGRVKVEFRKVPCPDTEPFVQDKLAVDADGKLTLELRVTEERAYGDVFFCIGDNFKSTPFFVAHLLPPQRPKPQPAPIK